MTDTRADVEAIRARLTDVPTLLARLGIAARPDGSRWWILCPAHGEKTPSCAVRLRPGITWHCFGCAAGGDVFALIAAAYRLTLPGDFLAVKQCAAIFAGLDLSAPLPPMPALPPPPPPPPYPPAAEVRAIWSDARPLSRDQSASLYLMSRALDPDTLDAHGVVRVLRPDADVPRWAMSRGGTWAESGHRILTLMRDSSGNVRSVRARHIGPTTGPKALPPSGHRASGLVMAERRAQEMLRGSLLPKRLIIVEGEPDFWTWAQTGHAAIGVESGSWSEEMGRAVPDGTVVSIRTHHDPAGDRYAAEIRATLAGRCDVRREGTPGQDENDRAMAMARGVA